MVVRAFSRFTVPISRFYLLIKERPMSIEAVQRFMSRLQNDEALQEKLRDVSTETDEQRRNEILRIATAAGFEFTAADYDAAVEAELARQHAAGEIDDVQLSTLAGGSVDKITSGICVPHTKSYYCGNK